MEKAKRFYNGALSKERTERENKNACLARKLAADGIVLLKNDDRVLPLDITKPVALFGSGADKTIKVALVLVMLITDTIFQYIRG